MEDFDELVRRVAREEMKKQALTHAHLAERVGMARPQVTRMLSSKTRLLPLGWIRLLDALGLELTVSLKDSSQGRRL